VKPWVAFTLLGALLFAIGNALQKHGLTGRLPPLTARAAAAGPLRFFGAMARSPVWLLGTAITLVAVAAETQALGLGELSAVKPLSRIQSVFVLGIGGVILGERLLRVEWLGLAVMLAGVWLLALEPADAVVSAHATAANAALGIGVASAIALAVVLGDRHAAHGSGEWAPALAAGALFGLGDVMMKAGTEGVRARLGGFDLARGDAAAALVACPEFQLAIAFSAGAFLLQQLAFSRGRVSLVAPIVGVGATALVVVLGVAFLGESLGRGRALGIGLTLLGTLLVAGREARGPRLAAA